MNSGDLLAQMLMDYGVRYCFGIPGGQTQPLYDAMARSGGRLRHILIRDERSGPYAADAYARITGRLAVCDAVPGPGVVKLPSGLAEAYNSSVPLIAIAGDLPRAWRSRAPFGCAAQGLPQQALLVPVCKSFIQVDSQAELPQAVRHAFIQATSGRPGPVVLDIPADVFHERWDPAALPAQADGRYGSFPAARVRPPEEAVAAAARVLESAERPVMVIGGGGLISGACEEVRALAELLQLPVATTVSGKGVIAEEHPLAVGVLGGQYGEESANQVVREADVILLVGFKSSQQSTCAWQLPRPGQRIVHLDIDPNEIGKVFATEVGLVGDAATGLRDLRAQVRGASGREGWLARVQELRAAWRAVVEEEVKPHSPIRPSQIVHELQRQTDPGDIFVSDASFSIGWVTSFYDVRQAGRRCLFPRGSATLGFGLPAAIGACLADPEHRVICISGDGGIAYALGELATCRKYDLRITLVVLNNSCLGYSRWGERQGAGNYENVDFPLTDFAAIARGFGCVGLSVDHPDQLADAVAEALRCEGPVVLDVQVDPWATPELNLRHEWLASRS